MDSAPSHEPEDRWRSAIEQRGRPIRLELGRLLRDFGYATHDPDAGDLVEERLEQVGVSVRPPLHDVPHDAVITLELMIPRAGYQPSMTSDFAATSERPLAPSQDPWLADASDGERAKARPALSPADDERRAQEAFEQAAAAVAQRLAELERESADDRELAVPAREQGDELGWRADQPDAGADWSVLRPGLDRGAAEPATVASDEPPLVWHDGEPAAAPVPLTALEKTAARRAAPTPDAGRGARLLGLAGLVLVLAALGAAGYLAARDPERPAGPAALAGPAARAGVALRHPPGWQRRSEAPQIPGLRFEAPLVLAPAGQSSTVVVAGLVKDAIGSDLLPAGLRRSLPEPVPAPEPVLLGDIETLRYSRLEPSGVGSALTLYAAPTARGSAVVACYAPIEAAAFFDDCERSAATLQLDGLPSQRLDGASALALGPSRSYGRRVARAIAAVDGAVESDGARLRRASTARAQATSARAIAAAFESAAGQLDAAAVSARDREGHAEVVAAIRAGADAYDGLAAAARDGDRGDYADSSGAVRRAAARLRAAVRALRKLGYDG